MQDETAEFRVTYKGQTLTYTFFYELCEFVDEVDQLDPIDDEVEIAAIAQKLDARAVKL